MRTTEILIKGKVLYIKRTLYCYLIHAFFVLLSLILLALSAFEVYKAEYIGAAIAGILGFLFLPTVVFSFLSEYQTYFNSENGTFYREGYEFSNWFLSRPIQGRLQEIKEVLLKTNVLEEYNMQKIVIVLRNGNSFELIGFRGFEEARIAKNQLESFLVEARV